MPKPLLDTLDLCNLTGLGQPAAQKRWLTKNGIAFCERNDGSVMTTWEAVNHALLAGKGQRSGRPNLQALEDPR